jgi:hypothetical protein
VNDDRIIYHWAWTKADPADPNLPEDYQTQLEQRVL